MNNKKIPLVVTTMVFVLIMGSQFSVGQNVPPVNMELTRVQSELLILNQRRDKLDGQLDQWNAIYKQLEQQKEVSLAKQKEVGVSDSSYNDVMKNLQIQRIQLMIDVAGLDARREAMLTAVKQVGASHSAEEVQTLEKIVELKQDRLADMRKLSAKGGMSRSELNKATIEFLESKVRLSQAKTPKTDSKLNQDLLNVSLERAEKQARLAKTESLIATIEPARGVIVQSVENTNQARLVKAKLLELRDDLIGLRVELDAKQEQLKRVKSKY